MGHQESFIRLSEENKNAEKYFDDLLNQFEKYDIKTKKRLMVRMLL